MPFSREISRDFLPACWLLSGFYGDSVLHSFDSYFRGVVQCVLKKKSTSKSTPRVRFEAISVGVALALREKPDLIPKSMEWLSSEEFKTHTTTHASNSPKRVNGRIEFVKDKLLEDN